jgi:L-seryl-tRNA(Ser) seleniumtransferase
MKVGKEEMVGLLTAIELYLQQDSAARRERDERIVAAWRDTLNRLPGVAAERSFPNEAGQPLPRALVTIEAGTAGIDRDTVIKRLLSGDPAISVSPAGTSGLYLNPMTLTEAEAEIVLSRLQAILSGA